MCLISHLKCHLNTQRNSTFGWKSTHHHSTIVLCNFWQAKKKALLLLSSSSSSLSPPSPLFWWKISDAKTLFCRWETRGPRVTCSRSEQLSGSELKAEIKSQFLVQCFLFYRVPSSTSPYLSRATSF